MRRTPLVCMIAVLALLGAAACGGDDDEGGGGGGGEDVSLSSDEQAFADGWAETLTDEEDGFTFTDVEAQCMGEAIMAEVGTEPFDEAEIEPGDLAADDSADSPGELLGDGAITDAQAEAILDTWDGCADLNSAFVDLLAVEAELDESAQECVEDGLEGEDLVREGFKASLTSEDSQPSEEVTTALVTLMGNCAGGEDGSGGLIVDGIAEQLAQGGVLDEEQAQCVAQEMVDAIGVDRLVELGVAGGEFETADAEIQQEMAAAVLGAAEACDVPLSSLGG